MSNTPPSQPGQTPGPARGPQPGDHDAPAAGASPDRGSRSGKGTKGTSGQSDPLRSSRAGGFYLSVIALGVVLIFLIVFVTQNTDPTTVRFLPWEAEIPLAVALLIAAVAGIFLAGIAASLRIVQLRRRVKHDRKA